MHKSWFSRLILVTVVLTLGWAAFVSAAGPANRVDKVSNKGFDQTFKAIETAIKSQGMMVVATIDHQNMLSMVGARIKGSKTIEFGKPDMGKMVLPSDPDAGLEMPARIYIYERADGKTVVSYYKPSAGYAQYGKDNLSMAGQMMDEMLSKIVEQGTK